MTDRQETMIESQFLPDGRQWIWNSSSLDPAICSRKYYYQVVRGVRAKAQSPDLIFGLIFARSVERYHRERAAGNSYDDAVHFVVAGALQDTWYEDGPWQSTHHTKTRENLIRSIIWYFEEYEEDNCQTVILADGRPAVELRAKFHLEGEIWLSVRIDRLVIYAGDYYIQDQKTTGSSIGPWYFKRYSPNNQMSQYTLAAKVIWKVPVKGVMIDAAQIAGGFTRFGRGFTFRTDDQLDEWVEGAKFTIEKTWEASKRGWPMNESACMLYNGCEYLNVCSKHHSVREAYLATEYEERRYSPLE